MARVGGELGMNEAIFVVLDVQTINFQLAVLSAPRHPLDDQEELKRNISSSSKILSFSAH